MPEPFDSVFMQRALIAVGLAGVNCAVIGVFVVIRRMAFAGHAMAHAILPGIVFAQLRSVNVLVGAFASAMLAAVGIALATRRRVVHEDTSIGVVTAAFFAGGILLMGESSGYRDFHAILFGSLFAIGHAELSILAGATLANLALIVAFRRPLELASCDPGFARQIGFHPERIRYLLLAQTAIAVVAAIQAVGVLLTSALLITPAATGLLFGRGILGSIMISVGIAILAGVIGLSLSYYADVGAGASVVLVATALFIGTRLGKGAWNRWGQGRTLAEVNP